jgi:3-phenylpropionate/trans-cinnamate dioxygenase ferredoxin reductase subunit|tara:strand:- start:9928 stop:11214 length:1287 start_codon:yes stop_codon:yes gene_type:complete
VAAKIIQETLFMTKKCIIIGASHAAAQLTTSLRQGGWEGEILVIGDEPHLPYQRPPLSKAFLSGEKTAEDLVIRPATFYQKQDVQFRQDRVIEINREKQTVTLANGEELGYDKLALCMGSRVREINLPGCNLNGIHYLRNLADAESIKNNAAKDQHAVIVGGGYIGLETAASLRKLGMQVSVLEMEPRILKRVTAPEVSEFYHRLHTENGVQIINNISVSGFQGNSHVEKVVCADGSELPAHLVVIGVGVLPNTELAEASGLVVNNGIMVDEFCVTSDPNIVAAGDCTNKLSKIYDRRIRLESVPNATEQAKTAAASMCDSQKDFTTLPWFWSDQYELKLQIAGLSQGYDQIVVRGNRLTTQSFAVFYLKSGQLIAADCVNRPQEFLLSKKLIAENIAIPPEQLEDDSIPAKEILLRIAGKSGQLTFT